jgi:hypothetical protein
MGPSLVPIRIDVVTDDKSIRIVDTLLMDPNLWPIPRPFQSQSFAPNTAVGTEWIEANCQLLANQVLSDQECVGMGRTSRFFTGRVDLWSVTMQQSIVEQIRPQLQQVASAATLSSRRLSLKREQDTTPADSSKKRVKTEAMGVDSLEQATPNIFSQKDTATLPNPSIESEVGKESQLVPIHLRLSVHGVRIHDDFDWDLSLGVSPLQLAQAMGKDLRLSDEAIVAIAIDIAEQAQGLSILPDKVDWELDEGGPPDRRNTSAAWNLDERVHITNVAHLVAQHRHK